ncbi:Facilitated trehalose transporter Tret1 [Trachymyrmex septentrionalis]|uniref:Facilitated trehalose transporter Tret1 n=2 Tax=Trachymyrmex septentrionalis TaxID=34720 RepID=A0A195FPC4_9HYME|nr:Facilitated trehalose transporter Tret1 [Trachymyrmex septentrionalis]
MGWASPSMSLLMNGDDAGYPVRLNLEEISWVASLLTLGAVPGCIISALTVNIIGRKNTMLFSAVPSVIGWLLIVFATSSPDLFISRFLSGLAMGMHTSITPMYLGEISPAKIRGYLGSMLIVSMKLGVLIEYTIGPFLSVRNLALISLAAPCLFVVTFIWLPESPYYLIRCDAKEKAINSLVQLRGKKDVYKEADSIEQSVKADLANKAGLRELLFIRGNRRALTTLVCLVIFQQLSGSQVLIQYSQIIFDKMDSNLEGKYLTMILGAVQLVCTIVCMIITDYSGRKLLLTISAIGTACSTAIVATYFHLQYNHVDISNITWLPAIGVILFIVMYSIGLSALPFTMAGELFSMNVKALGNTMGMMTLTIVAFVVTNLYLIISEGAGVHTPFWIFTACCFAAAIFTFFYVPETKGKTLEQIQRKLHNPSKGLVMDSFYNDCSENMKKLYLAAVAGNLGMLSVALFLGWASPSLPLLLHGGDAEYPVRLNLEEASWVTALLSIGAAAGSVISALIVNIIGRKNSMLFTVVPSIIAWLLIVFATSSWELYISRFISGLALGITSMSTSMYMSEISPADIRGNLGSILAVAGKLGILIEFTIGPFLSVRNLALVSLAGPCLFLVTFIWLPESPYHLMRCNTKQKAINSLIQLRGKEDVYKEADSIEQFVKDDLANKAGIRELLFIRGNRRALITLLCLALVQQLSGSQAVMQYAQLIFDEMNGNLEGKYLTMILGAMQLICAIVSMFITDCSGRKSWLMISTIGSACSTAMVATYFHLQYYHIDTSNIIWLPAIGVILYRVMFSLGLGVLPFTMGGELFPMNVKALGIMIGTMTIHITAFVVESLYLVVSESAGMHTPFWIFTACSLAGTLFTIFYVPETKGRTLEQIQKKLHGSLKQEELKNEVLSRVNI